MTVHRAVESVLRHRRDAWEVVPFRRLATERGVRNTVLAEQPLSLSSSGRLYERTEATDRQFGSEASERNRWVVHPGDLVVNPMWLLGGAIGVSDRRGAVSPDYRVFALSGRIDARYLHHLLRSEPYLDQYRLYMRAETTFDRRVGKEDFGQLPILVPPMAIQRAIADYLDAEIAAMDAVLGRKLKMIRLLQEQIDSVILQFIGASPLVRSDPQLAARPMRRMLAKLDRLPEPEGRVVTAFRDGQVTARTLRRAEGFTESWTDGARVQGVCRDDVVVHGLDGFAGAIGISEADGVCSPIYHVCAPLDGGDPHFYGQMLRLLATTGYLGNFATSTRERAVDFRNWDLFGRIPLPVVDVGEQRKIGDRIRRLAPIRASVGRSEGLLLERREAIITAAVAGQIEIPGVAV